VSADLNSQELALYRLIWQRTLASQMADATGVTVSVRLAANAADRTTGELTDCEFAASGTTITFPGYRAVYVASKEETGDDAADNEALLPPLVEGDQVPVASIEPNGHTTSPPARYTEASLVKRLEELGIGRPSTWASIIQTVQDRGYVWKKGQALVPTWTAFAVVRLLEEHFDALVDYDFTASIDEDLDAIARGDRAKDKWLKRFYFGDTGDGDTEPIAAEAGVGDDALLGLKRLVEENLDEIDAAEINTFPLGADESGQTVVAKPGKYGPYVKRGDDTASVPDDLPPDELTLDKAVELLAAPKSDDPIGELDGYPVYAKNGRYGPYVQWGDHDDPPPGLEKPKMSSLFKTMVLERITMDEAEALLQLPRHLGDDPEDGVPIYANNGRYGPYVQWGDHDDPPPGLEKPKMSSLFKTMVLERITMDEAEALLQLPRHLGDDPDDGVAIYANNGRYGPYVQKDKDYRNIDSEDQLLQITLDEALEIFRQPKVYKRGGRNMAAKGPLKEFGTDPVSQKHVVAKDGRFGVYVTDGETNASLGKGDRLEEMTPERAYELLAIRREAVAAKGGSTKKAGRKKAAAKKTGAKKTGAKKKSAAKKAGAAKKSAAAKSSAAKKPAASAPAITDLAADD